MKNLKKAVSLMLTAALAITLSVGLSACNNSNNNSGGEQTTSNSGGGSASTDEGREMPAAFKIGFPWDTASTDPTWVSIYESVKAAVEAAGGELVNVQTDLTADGLIDNVSELISRGVDGILFMPASDSMLPTVDAMCSDAGVYWGTMFRTISDPEIREAMYASEYFAGGCNEDDIKAASDIVQAMGDMGCKNICCINIAKGDTSSDLRDAGAKEGAEKAGVNILNTTYGITNTNDMTKTIESYIAAYPEMDGILLLGTYCDAALPTIEKALEDHGKQGEIKVGRIDFDSTMGEYLEKDAFHVSYGGQQQIDPLMSAVILVNEVIGTPIVEDGPSIIITPYLELTSVDEANDFTEFFLGDTTVYTPEEIADLMIKYWNPDIDKAYIDDLLAGFSIADVVSRHK